MGLTAERDTVAVGCGESHLVVPVKGSTTIYQGALVALDANGYAIPGAHAEGLIAAGRAEETVENSGLDGAKSITVARGVFYYDNSATTANKVGADDMLKPCFIEDDHTVTMLPTGASVAGKVIYIRNGEVAVEIGMATVDMTVVNGAVLLPITGTGVASGNVFDGYVLTGITTTKTVIIDGHTYTMAAATSDASNEFADFAGLVQIAATDSIIIIGSSFASVKASKTSA